MKLSHFLLLVIGIAALTSLGTYFFFKSTILQSNTFPVHVQVVDNNVIGLNVDPGFYFGSIVPGGGGRRELIINDIKEDVRVYVQAEGKITPWLTYPNNFVVKKEENKTIEVSVAVPSNALPGNYTGNLTVILRKA